MKSVGRIAFVLVALLGVLLLSGCDNLLSSDDDSGGGDSGDSGYASVTVYNYTDVTIWYLYITPSSSSDWGPDQLGSSTIPSGGAFTVNNIPAGTYDLRAVDYYGYNYYASDQVLEGGHSYNWTLD